MRLAHWVVFATATMSLGATGQGYHSRTSISAPAGGTVELVSYGVVEIAPDQLPRMQTLHIRFSLINQSRVPWSIDLRRFTLTIREHELQPLFVNSDVLGLPLALVGDSRHRIFDAYYVVPHGVEVRTLRELAVRWEIVVGDRRHAGGATLVRDDGTRSAVAMALGWGDRWWCDPRHPWPQFYRRPGPIIHRPPTRVIVHTVPERV